MPERTDCRPTQGESCLTLVSRYTKAPTHELG
jgi:hypothetical protein